MEEQLIDEIVWNHWRDRDTHFNEEYVSDTQYQDEGDDLPFGSQIVYDGGPRVEIVDLPLAQWHKEKAIQLLEDESYDSLVEYFSHTRAKPIPDGGPEKPTVYAVFEKGDHQPLIHDFGVGGLNFLWSSEEDAAQFAQAYFEQYGITDPTRYKVVEFQVTDEIEVTDSIGMNMEQWTKYMERQYGEDDDAEEREEETDQVGLTDY